jgi:hypothetical protein
MNTGSQSAKSLSRTVIGHERFSRDHTYEIHMLPGTLYIVKAIQ